MKRKHLQINFVQLALTLLLAFVTQNAWAQSTADIGKVLGADGKMYKTVAAATNAGTTASGIIAYWGSAGSVESGNSSYRGMAIALEDAFLNWGTYPNHMEYCTSVSHQCSTATPYCSTVSEALNAKNGIAATQSAQANNGEYHWHNAVWNNSGVARPSEASDWAIPSIGQWNLMAQGLTGNSSNLSDTDNPDYHYNNLSTKINAAGGTHLEWLFYWSSTEVNESNAWCFNIGGLDYGRNGSRVSSFAKNHNDEYMHVRMFFAFSSATAAVYTISYNANGGSGAPSSQTKDGGIDIALSSTVPTRSGCTFTGWNTKADGSGTSYANGATFTGNANTTLYAQWTFQGSGTNENPYLIASTDHWNLLADKVNAGNTYSGMFFRLTNDISVTTMVGNSESNSFRGTFDGYGHTLTISYNTNSDYTAPFSYIQGATFKNLKVTGSITTTRNLAAGIAGLNTGSTASFDQCVTDVAINSSSTTIVGWGAYDYHGGFLARTTGVNVNLTDCVCGGSVDGSSASQAKGAGFVGLAENCTVTGTRCLSTTSYTNVLSWNSLCHSAGAARNASVFYYVNANDNESNVGTQVTTQQLADGSYATALQAGCPTTVWIQYAHINQPMLKLFALNQANDGYYLIGSEQEWRNFATLIQTTPKTNARMTDDISVTTMMGSGDKPFSGIFDGDYHTLTVNISGSGEKTAPFCYVKEENGVIAVIRRLKVAGSVSTSDKYAGGIVGYSEGQVNIIGCGCSVVIHSTVNGDGTHGGLVGYSSGSLYIEGCTFTGKMLTTTGTYKCGGFIGWNGNAAARISSSLYAPAAIEGGETEVLNGSDGTISATFSRNGGTIANCYYTRTLGTAQGTQVYSITAGTDVTISGLGEPLNTYPASGLTFYNPGLRCGNVYYAANGESVSLNLGNTSHSGYSLHGYSVTAGTLTGSSNPYSLAMLAANVTVNVTYSASKSITGYTSGTDGWYLISSPIIEAVNPSGVTNMTANAYDLFRFNQNAEMEWQNYKTHNNDAQNPFNALASGQGYLYANSGDVELTFVGTPYSGNGVVNLNYSTTNPDSRIHGWNLVGNPFGTTATISAMPFYRMNGTHTEIIAADNNNIASMEGIFVRATGSGQSVTFTPGGSKGGERNTDNLIINLSYNNGTVIDRAIVSFDEGYTLEKFQIDENNTKLYIPQNGEDYAIAFSNRTGELPLHFVAKEIGRYTITVETNDHASLNGVSLIDKLENTITDLSLENNYSFIGSITDNPDRFVIVFKNPQFSDNSDIFAYQSGNDIIVNGESELQVFDVMGRMVAKQQINGVQTCHGASLQTGVYIFRLNGKSQKIVIK